MTLQNIPWVYFSFQWSPISPCHSFEVSPCHVIGLMTHASLHWPQGVLALQRVRPIDSHHHQEQQKLEEPAWMQRWH